MQTSEVPLEAINEATDAAVPQRSSSTRSKKIRSKASVEISRRESDQCLTTKKTRNNGSMKRSKSFGEQPSSDLLDNLGLSPGILARKKRISNRSPKRNSSKSPKRETSESKLSPKPETIDVSEESSASKRRERKSSSLKISKSSSADQASATLSPDTNESLKAPPAPFCIENMGVSPSLLAKKKRSSSKSPMRQSDSMVADKKISSLRRSKSDAEQSSSTSDLSDESSIATSSSILITSKAKQMMDSPVELVPKRSSSTRSKKLKSKASLESAISRRESDQCLTTKKKRNVSSMKRSKSFGEQASFASSDSTATTRPPSAIARSMLSIKEKPAVPKRSSSKNKKINFGSNDVESADKKERTGTGMKRSKSFGDTSKGLPRKQKASTSASKTDIKRSKSFGANNSTKSLLDTSDSRRSSKQNKKFGKSEAREIHSSSLMELLNVTLTPSEKDEIPKKKKKKVKQADLRVSFSDKAMCKKIKHSKIDPGMIWYSEAELKEIREREKEVKRKARSCTSATLFLISKGC